MERSLYCVRARPVNAGPTWPVTTSVTRSTPCKLQCVSNKASMIRDSRELCRRRSLAVDSPRRCWVRNLPWDMLILQWWHGVLGRESGPQRAGISRFTHSKPGQALRLALPIYRHGLAPLIRHSDLAKIARQIRWLIIAAYRVPTNHLRKRPSSRSPPFNVETEYWS